MANCIDFVTAIANFICRTNSAHCLFCVSEVMYLALVFVLLCSCVLLALCAVIMQRVF